MIGQVYGGERVPRRTRYRAWFNFLRRDSRLAHRKIVFKIASVVRLPALKARVNDVSRRIWVNPMDRGLSRDLFVYGEREVESFRVLNEILKPGDRVLDLGCNIGHYAAFESERVGPAGRVVAIEPNPKTAEFARRNLDRYANVDFLSVAVGRRTGLVQFHAAAHGNLSAVTPTAVSRSMTTFELPQWVPCITADDLVATHPDLMDRVDLVRMDVEGYEVEILSGLSKYLENCVSVGLFLEIHPQLIRERLGDATYSQFVDSLEQYDLEIIAASLSISSREDRRIKGLDYDALRAAESPMEVFFRKTTASDVG